MSASKSCEHCGDSFECSANQDSSCWCMKYDLNADNLRKLREKFSDCLCEKCLLALAQAK